MAKENKNCGNCLWHDVFSWVCCNGESEHRADYTSPDTVCRCWERGLNYVEEEK